MVVTLVKIRPSTCLEDTDCDMDSVMKTMQRKDGRAEHYYLKEDI
jgi:hypothetical protein